MEIVFAAVAVVSVIGMVYIAARTRPSGGTAAADGIADRDAQLKELAVRLAEREAQLEARDQRIDERDRRIHDVACERDKARAERDEIRADRDEARTKLAEHKTRVEELEKAREQLDTQFKGIAADVLKNSSETLLKQAKQQFDSQHKLSDAELEKREMAIGNLVKPVREHLDKFEKQVNEMEQKREGAYKKLSTEVGSLNQIAGGLRDVLKSSSMRGHWGEQQLRNVFKVSGLRDHIDFDEQPTVAGGDGLGRPDAVVHVPGGVEIVIDAKTPLDSYSEAREEQDEGRQLALLKEHAKSLLGHAKTLGGRDYSAAVAGSPDFVVMYVPTDSILDAAMAARPTLWDDAWEKHRVLIATPGLLLAFLRTVALAWQQQAMQENAQAIAQLGRDLHDRLRIYTDHVDGVGRGLRQALRAYNDSIGSLERRVLPQARKFETLGAVAGTKPIPQLDRVETEVRSVSAPQTADNADADAGPEDSVTNSASPPQTADNADTDAGPEDP